MTPPGQVGLMQPEPGMMTGRRVIGHAAVFDSLSEDLGGFMEVIRAGAFTELLRSNPDVRALINHDPNLLLGRTKAATLTLREDRIGLAISCDIPATYFGRSLIASMERGDLTQMSFAFVAGADKWSTRGTGLLREVLRVDGLYDVSPVVFPAYDAADAALRDAPPQGEAWQAAAGRRRLRLATRLSPITHSLPRR